jgi:hypothetical protein
MTLLPGQDQEKAEAWGTPLLPAGRHLSPKIVKKEPVDHGQS